jgi:predicted ArsR family transcriptional regulator
MTTTVEQGWWSELDDEVLACLRSGPQSTRELADRLKLSPAGATSVLLMLAAEGKIRVTAVELVDSVGGPETAPRSARPGKRAARLDVPPGS